MMKIKLLLFVMTILISGCGVVNDEKKSNEGLQYAAAVI